MPKGGSKPGERRGGRKPGTPNKLPKGTRALVNLEVAESKIAKSSRSTRAFHAARRRWRRAVGDDLDIRRVGSRQCHPCHAEEARRACISIRRVAIGSSETGRCLSARACPRARALRPSVGWPNT